MSREVTQIVRVGQMIVDKRKTKRQGKWEFWIHLDHFVQRLFLGCESSDRIRKWAIAFSSTYNWLFLDLCLLWEIFLLIVFMKQKTSLIPTNIRWCCAQRPKFFCNICQDYGHAYCQGRPNKIWGLRQKFYMGPFYM